jgi:hypothetical protein
MRWTGCRIKSGMTKGIQYPAACCGVVYLPFWDYMVPILLYFFHDLNSEAMLTGVPLIEGLQVLSARMPSFSMNFLSPLASDTGGAEMN